MPEGKLELKIGSLTFSSQGDEAWVSEQLDKVLKHASELSEHSSDPPPEAAALNGAAPQQPNLRPGASTVGPLANFLKSTNADKSHNSRFLATAIWLHKKGAARLQTGDVTKALSSNSQKRLANASESLKRNVGQGFCEKDGKQFFVTPEGYQSLGAEQ